MKYFFLPLYFPVSFPVAISLVSAFMILLEFAYRTVFFLREKGSTCAFCVLSHTDNLTSFFAISLKSTYSTQISWRSSRYCSDVCLANYCKTIIFISLSLKKKSMNI